MDRSKLAARIKTLRGQLHLTQRDFSLMTGISQARLSRIENETDTPNFDDLSNIAKAIGIELLTLLDEDAVIAAKIVLERTDSNDSDSH